MAGSPYIKSEPNDFNFNPNSYQPQQGGQFNMAGYGNMPGGANVDPSQLAQGGSYGQSFGSQNMSSSFVMGNAGIADDELAELAGSLDSPHGHGGFQHNQQVFGDNSMNQQPNYYNTGRMPITQQQQIPSSIYSHTPEGAPIQSPFVNGFNYNNFRPDNGHQQQAFNMSSSAGFANSVMRQQHMASMERKISESRSPASPNTPGINGLHIGEPQFPTPGLQRAMTNHRHSASMSHGWDSTPAQSWNDSSPFTSPANGPHMHHAQISEVLGSEGNKMGSSITTKLEPGLAGPSHPHVQSSEAKKRRRRESHNLVERRRRDNINDRIHDLANLVPQHRLDDEKVKKHLQTNSPLSPSITASNMSPPTSASLLATSAGKRASSVAQGLPMEDKDKGPNKGDILNSSVAWSRDVVWYMQLKMEQEAQLEELVSSLGGVWPFERTDDEIRMRSEINEVVQRNIRADNIQPYSRTEGSGLRVPGFTNVAGDTLRPGESGQGSSGSEMSPSYTTNSGGQQSAWTFNGGLKEEDEFDEDML